MGQLGEWILQVMSELGYVGIVLLMFLENVFPPIPSELIMPAAGFAAARGELSLVGVIVAGGIGS
ncbi:MAG: DedA family protein, partial [Flavobacteriales bacterium]